MRNLKLRHGAGDVFVAKGPSTRYNRGGEGDQMMMEIHLL